MRRPPPTNSLAHGSSRCRLLGTALASVVLACVALAAALARTLGRSLLGWLVQRQRGYLGFVGRIAPVRLVGHADRGEGDVEHVELLGEGLDDRPIAIEPVLLHGLAQVGAEELEAAFAQVRRGGDLRELESDLDRPLDVLEQTVFARLDERDRRALAAGATGPADPVDIRVGVGRHVEVDDVRDVLDVEAAGRDVRGDEDVQVAVAEAAHDAVALCLAMPPWSAAASWPRPLSASASSSTSPRVRPKTSVEVGSSTSRMRPSAASLSARRTT